MTEHNTVILSDGERGLRAATALLRSGELVAFPTETVYGLGADATNDRAVAAIFAAKGRPRFNPLIIHAANLAQARKIGEFSAEATDLAQAFWPGPMTLVVPRRVGAGLSDLVSAGLGTVAIRVPAHPLAQRLLTQFAGPVAAPSANSSGRVSPTTHAHVMNSLGGRIAAVVDGGPSDVGLESTIIGFHGSDPVLLRPGGLPPGAIEACLGRGLKSPASGEITAPGQLSSHYAPGSELRLNADAPGENEAWIGFGPFETAAPGLNLSRTGDLAEAAANLFAHLRDIDDVVAEHGLKRVAVARVPELGLGLAINDRLRRAAAPRN